MQDPLTVPSPDRTPRERRAFTIVELVVVVAIIGLLVGLLAPTLAGMRSAAGDVETASQVRQVVVAAISFADQRQGLLPAAGSAAEGEHATWLTALNPFLNRRLADIARSPEDRSPYWDAVEPITGIKRRSSYGVNFFLSGSLPGHRGAARLATLPRPDRTAWLSELAENGSYATSDHFHPELWLVDAEAEPGRQLALERRTDAAVHWGHLDGHVERLPVHGVYALDPASSIGNLIWLSNRLDPTIAR